MVPFETKPNAAALSRAEPRRRARSSRRASPATSHRALTTRHLALAFLAFVAAAAAWTAWRDVRPSDVRLLPCLFHALTDHPCPGCGITRACIALARGDFAGAWSFHPFAFVLMPLAALAALSPIKLQRAWISVPRVARSLSLGWALACCVALWAVQL